jgi:hypothetical protein
VQVKGAALGRGNSYPPAYETLKGKDLTYAVVGATIKGCCNPDQTSCSIAGIGCSGSDYKVCLQD